MKNTFGMDLGPLFGAGVAIASVIALDPGGWFPFSIAKWTAVLTVSLLTFGVTVWDGLPRIPVAFVVLWTGFLLLIASSAATGLGGQEAWFGTPIRHLGVVAWFIFAAVFATGLCLHRVRSFSHGIVVAGLFLGGYTTVELLFRRPVDFATNSTRLAGPYGSAAYLGAMSCLLVPVVVAVVLDRTSTVRWRVTAGVAAATLASGVIGSGSRSALLALVLAATLGLFTMPTRQFLRRGIALGAAVGVASVVAVVAALTGVFDRSAGWSTRLDEWRIGVRAVRSRPWRGVGPEGYRLVVDRYLDDGYVTAFGDDVLPDRAHNAVIDVAIASGLPAAALYVAIIVLIARSSVRLIRHGSTFERGLALAFIASLIQQQLLFSIAEIDPVFWLIAGMVVAADRRGLPSTSRDPLARRRTVGGAEVARVLAGVAVIVAVISAVSGVQQIAADRAARASDRAPDASSAEFHARRAVELAPTDPRHRVLLARSLERQGSVRGVEASIEALDRALEIAPLDPTVLREHARVASLKAAITGNDVDVDFAVGRWQGLIADAPSCARCHEGLGVTLLQAGRDEQARQTMERAAELGR